MRTKVVIEVTTLEMGEYFKERIMLDGSPLVNYDSRDYANARTEAEYHARNIAEALRRVGHDVEATSHGYNL